MIIPAIIVMAAGLWIIWLADRMWQERLTRNAMAGIRTPSTMRSDEAFRVANKAAAPLTAAAGVVLFADGLATALVPRHEAGIPLFGGVFVFLVLVVAGTLKGTRAIRE